MADRDRTSGLAAMLRPWLDQDRDTILMLPAGPAPLSGRRLFQYPGPNLLWQDGPVATLPWGSDQDLHPAEPAPWPGLRPARLVRRRRLDTLHDQAALVLLGDLAGAAEALAGAGALLADHAPPILLDRRGPAGLRDPWLAACLAALPPAYRRFPTDGPFVVAAAHPITLDLPATEVLDLPVDADLVAVGLHPPEPDAPGSGRYLGAALDARIWLPRPHFARLTLTLTADWDESGPFALRLDGRYLVPRTVTPDTARFGPVTIDPLASPVLAIAVPAGRPRADPVRWPRKLGARLRRLVITSA